MLYGNAKQNKTKGARKWNCSDSWSWKLHFSLLTYIHFWDNYLWSILNSDNFAMARNHTCWLQCYCYNCYTKKGTDIWAHWNKRSLPTWGILKKYIVIAKFWKCEIQLLCSKIYAPFLFSLKENWQRLGFKIFIELMLLAKEK